MKKRLRRLVIIVSSSTKGAYLYEFIELVLVYELPILFLSLAELAKKGNLVIRNL
jgi:hypothetical protein